MFVFFTHHIGIFHKIADIPGNIHTGIYNDYNNNIISFNLDFNSIPYQNVAFQTFEYDSW